MSAQHKVTDTVVSRPPARERAMSIGQVLSGLDREIGLDLAETLTGNPRDHSPDRIYSSSGSSHSPSPPKPRKRTKVNYAEDFDDPNDSDDKDYVDHPTPKEVKCVTLFSMTFSPFL